MRDSDWEAVLLSSCRRSVQERVVEVIKERVENRYIEVPEVHYVEKVVEVPHPVFEEKLVHVVKPVKQERIKYVKKPVYLDKVVEVPQIQVSVISSFLSITRTTLFRCTNTSLNCKHTNSCMQIRCIHRSW